ncbi:hypothetical protein WJX73_002618 [Symbiochloris irregularis]|uniref:Protein kinase domain-containing protein n=1 Tax=Symbiochloris irregularis TaxID=706552 RepID=A0AAW1PQE8_9CHLO
MVQGGGCLSSRPAVTTADGKHLVVPVADTVRLYGTASGSLAAVLKGHTQEVTAAVLNSRNDAQIYTASRDGTIILWDYAEGEIAKRYDVGFPVIHMVVPGRGKFAVLTLDVGGPVSRVRHFNLAAGSLFENAPRYDGLPPLTVSRSGKTVATFVRRTTHVWCPMQPKKPFLHIHATKAITCATISPDGEVLATGDATGRIRIYRQLLPAVLAAAGHPPCTTWHWHAHRVSCLTFGLDGAYLLSGGVEAVLVMWQMSTGQRSFLPRLGGPITSITPCVHDPAKFVLCQADNTIRIVNTATQSLETNIFGLQPPPRGLDHAAALLLPGSGELAIAVSNASMQLYDLQRDRHSALLQVAPRNTVSFTEDDSLSTRRASAAESSTSSEPLVAFAAASWDGSTLATVHCTPDASTYGGQLWTLQLWDKREGISSGSQRFELNSLISQPHRGAVTALAHHPTIHMLATTGQEGELRLWERHRKRKAPGVAAAGGHSTSWHCRSVASHRGEPMHAAAFSSDGSLLAASSPGAITLWDPHTNALLQTLPGPLFTEQATFHSLAFLPRTTVLAGVCSVPVPGIVAWDVAKKSVVWSSKVCVEGPIVADPEHACFAAALKVKHQGASQPSHQQRQGNAANPMGAVAVFGAESAVPKQLWALPGGSEGARVLFTPAQTPLHAAGAAITPQGMSPLVILTGQLLSSYLDLMLKRTVVPSTVGAHWRCDRDMAVAVEKAWQQSQAWLPPSTFATQVSLREAGLKICRRSDGGYDKIGQGGYGKVFKGMRNGATVVAIKALMAKETCPQSSQDVHDFSRALELELQVMHRARHPHIVTCFGVCMQATTQGSAFLLVMEYVDGGSLFNALGKGDRSVMWAGDGFGRQLAIQISDALAYLHDNKLAHLDVKSANILLSGDKQAAKLADFGLLQVTQEQKGAANRGLCRGTPGWMAPEVKLGFLVCERADIFALGVVIWELVTAERPHNHLPLRNVRVGEECEQWVADLISACLHPCPYCRPTARHVLTALRKSSAVPAIQFAATHAAHSTPEICSYLELIGWQELGTKELKVQHEGDRQSGDASQEEDTSTASTVQASCCCQLVKLFTACAYAIIPPCCLGMSGRPQEVIKVVYMPPEHPMSAPRNRQEILSIIQRARARRRAAAHHDGAAAGAEGCLEEPLLSGQADGASAPEMPAGDGSAQHCNEPAGPNSAVGSSCSEQTDFLAESSGPSYMAQITGLPNFQELASGAAGFRFQDLGTSAEPSLADALLSTVAHLESDRSLCKSMARHGTAAPNSNKEVLIDSVASPSVQADTLKQGAGGADMTTAASLSEGRYDSAMSAEKKSRDLERLVAQLKSEVTRLKQHADQAGPHRSDHLPGSSRGSQPPAQVSGGASSLEGSSALPPATGVELFRDLTPASPFEVPAGSTTVNTDRVSSWASQQRPLQASFDAGLQSKEGNKNEHSPSSSGNSTPHASAALSSVPSFGDSLYASSKRTATGGSEHAGSSSTPLLSGHASGDQWSLATRDLLSKLRSRRFSKRIDSPTTERPLGTDSAESPKASSRAEFEEQGAVRAAHRQHADKEPVEHNNDAPREAI